MRSICRRGGWLPAALVGALSITACAAGDEDATSSSSQAVQGTDESAEPGQQDVLESDEVLGPRTQGERGPAQPADPAYRARLAAYFAALEQATEGWRAAGMSQAEIDERGGQLRAAMMDGERP